MNILLRITLLITLVSSMGKLYAIENHKILKGTVFQNGKPAKGVHVTVDKSRSSYFTSFDGKYEVRVAKKSKWIKFQLGEKKVIINIDSSRDGYLDCELQDTVTGNNLTESIGIRAAVDQQ